jgi:hypothetical protein
MKPERIIKVDGQGNVLDGIFKPTSERKCIFSSTRSARCSSSCSRPSALCNSLMESLEYSAKINWIARQLNGDRELSNQHVQRHIDLKVKMGLRGDSPVLKQLKESMLRKYHLYLNVHYQKKILI